MPKPQPRSSQPFGDKLCASLWLWKGLRAFCRCGQLFCHDHVGNIFDNRASSSRGIETLSFSHGYIHQLARALSNARLHAHTLRGECVFSNPWLLAQATKAILWKLDDLGKMLSRKLSAALRPFHLGKLLPFSLGHTFGHDVEDGKLV